MGNIDLDMFQNLEYKNIELRFIKGFNGGILVNNISYGSVSSIIFTLTKLNNIFNRCYYV